VWPAGRPKAPPPTEDELFELDQRVFLLTALCVSREVDHAYTQLVDDMARSYRCVRGCSVLRGVMCRGICCGCARVVRWRGARRGGL